MNSLPDVVRARLKELAKQFVRSLPERLDALEAALKNLESLPDYDHAAVFEAKNCVHKLSGAGATFGMMQLSNLSREMEIILGECLQKDELPKNENVLALRELFAKLKSEYDRKQDELTTVSRPEAPQTAGASVEGIDMGHDSNRVLCLWENGETLYDDLRDQLGFFGFHVLHVNSLEPVQRVLTEGKQVILTLDVQHFMNDPKTVDALGALNSTPEADRLRILFLSEYDDFPTRLAAVRNGGDAFFAFPFDIPRLIDKIDSLFSSAADEPYHILIVDDDPEQISYYAMILQQAGMITSVVTDPMNVIRVLVESKPELILMDMYMPSCSGIELASLIRQQDAFISIPIIFLSIEKDVEKQLFAIKRGGDDFLTKPIKAEHLITSVSIRAERTRQLRYFMERDSLTGLLNHTQLKRRLVDELDRARRIGNPMSFVMIDLDHFKSVNDNYGHLTGDRVIKALSRLLQERLRKTDTIGRYGGEEFGVILFNSNAENAERTMNEIRESFSRIRQRDGDKDFFVTLSCGIASFPDYEDALKIGEEADKALYAAKRCGRNRTVVAGRSV